MVQMDFAVFDAAREHLPVARIQRGVARMHAAGSLSVTCLPRVTQIQPSSPMNLTPVGYFSLMYMSAPLA